jgi:peptidoglycan-associated lipoprotein
MKNLVLFLVAALLVVGCSSKKKAEEGQGLTGSDTTVNNTPMSFDPAGSDSGTISGLMSINFEYDKASLSKEAKDILKGNAGWINRNEAVNIQIEGHCDSRGSIEYNLSLGERRAKSVKDYLVSLGVASSRLTIISYGEEKPLENAETEAAWAKNRRANFVPLAK